MSILVDINIDPVIYKYIDIDAIIDKYIYENISPKCIYLIPFILICYVNCTH